MQKHVPDLPDEALGF